MTTQTNDNRIYLYDNVKAVLIFMVVTGHFFTSHTEDFRLANVLFTFIYSFHMPAFIFVSGLLKKEYNEDSKIYRIKILQLITAGYLLKICISFTRYIIYGTTSFKLLTEEGIPWYLFVLAYYEIIVYLIRGLNRHNVFIISILVAMFAGYDNSLGDYLCLSRAIVYLPFYLAGYYLTPEKILNFTRKLYIRITSAVIMISYIILCITKTGFFYKYRRLFTGRNSFSTLNGIIKDCGFDDRLFVMVLAGILTLTLIGILPDKKLPVITNVGSKTLQIYFWHRIIIYFIENIEIYERLTEALGVTTGKYTYLLLSVVLTLILTLPIFAHPTKGIFTKDKKTNQQVNQK